MFILSDVPLLPLPSVNQLHYDSQSLQKINAIGSFRAIRIESHPNCASFFPSLIDSHSIGAPLALVLVSLSVTAPSSDRIVGLTFFTRSTESKVLKK